MSLKDQLRSVAARLRAEAQRLAEGASRDNTQALTELLRPNVGPMPPLMRRLVEPLLALAGLMALLSLLSAGIALFGGLVVVAGLIYTILTHLFGLDLDLRIPQPAW